MSKSLPPLTWFRSFEAAARTLSSTAAAREIGLTQSAVSQQIKALETRLGVVLFDRHARGLSLTDEGRKLLPQVETALELLEAAAAGVAPDPGARLLTVAASISVIEWVIGPALQAFHAERPGQAIRFVSTIWPDEFTAARADVEIRFGSARQVGAEATLLGSTDLITVCAPGPMAQRLQSRISDLAQVPLIQSVGTTDSWADWGKALQIEGLAPQIFADSYGVALSLAVQGNGVALVSLVVAARALSEGRVVQVHPLRRPAKEGYFLHQRAAHPRAADFAAWLQRQVRDVP